MTRHARRSFLHEHSLSLAAASVLVLWVVLYSVSNPDTHWGSFFGNAIADWSGVVVMVLATMYMYEKGSQESRRVPAADGRVWWDRLRDHSLTIFLGITLLGWIALYAHSGVNTKWGQVVGNVVSEWVQSIGMVLLTKKLVERRRTRARQELNGDGRQRPL